MAAYTTEFFKDGDRMAIRTTHNDEFQFLVDVAGAFASMIEDGAYEHDWEFQFERWLPCVVDLASTLRSGVLPVCATVPLTAGDFDVTQPQPDNPEHWPHLVHSIIGEWAV